MKNGISAAHCAGVEWNPRNYFNSTQLSTVVLIKNKPCISIHRFMNRNNKNRFLVTASVLFFGLVSLQAAVTGQWDFKGGLSASIGNDLEYFDLPGGETELATQFGTTSSFGIPDIDGQSANVMKMPKNKK